MDWDNCTDDFKDAIWAEGSDKEQYAAIFVDNLMLQMINAGMLEKIFSPAELVSPDGEISFDSVLQRLLYMANLNRESSESERNGSIKITVCDKRYVVTLLVSPGNESFSLKITEE